MYYWSVSSLGILSVQVMCAIDLISGPDYVCVVQIPLCRIEGNWSIK